MTIGFPPVFPGAETSPLNPDPLGGKTEHMVTALRQAYTIYPILFLPFVPWWIPIYMALV